MVQADLLMNIKYITRRRRRTRRRTRRRRTKRRRRRRSKGRREKMTTSKEIRTKNWGRKLQDKSSTRT